MYGHGHACCSHGPFAGGPVAHTWPGRGQPASGWQCRCRVMPHLPPRKVRTAGTSDRWPICRRLPRTQPPVLGRNPRTSPPAMPRVLWHGGMGRPHLQPENWAGLTSSPKIGPASPPARKWGRPHLQPENGAGLTSSPKKPRGGPQRRRRAAQYRHRVDATTTRRA
jgi:hypothetical protein